MKRIIITILFVICAFSTVLNASPAYPHPIEVTQPDGTVITIQIYGDEFLHWTTCGNSLVVPGEDGYYYLATFDADGRSISTGQRVKNGAVTSRKPGAGSPVTPPQSAVDRAKKMRQEAFGSKSAMHKSPSKSTPSKSISLGTDKRFLVILVDFSDYKFSAGGGGEASRQAFDDMINKEGYSANGAYGSVRDYYKANSLDKFIPQFDVYGPITVSHKLSYYTDDDGSNQNPGAPSLLAEACGLADDSIDFSQYDQDGDGYIDNVYMFYAGYSASEGNSNSIWPHQWSVYYKSFTFDGKRLDNYACGSEFKGSSGSSSMTGIGTFCHEFGHVIGLPDFYDTDYEENGQGEGLGDYSLMDSGSYNQNSTRPPYLTNEERTMLGWMDDGDRPLISSSNTLLPIQSGKALYSPTTNDGEYFTYEFRNGTGWDKGLDAGLLIYHADKSDNIVTGSYTASDMWDKSSINDYSSHQCFDLIEASDNYVGFGNDVHLFTSTTTPAAKDWAGNATGYNLRSIYYTTASATFNCDNKQSISGRVYDIDGNLIEGATVSVTEEQAEAAPSSFAKKLVRIPFKSNSNTTTVTTGSDGTFDIEVKNAVGKVFNIVVTKSGFLTSTGRVTYNGPVDKDFYLQRPTIASDVVFKKHYDDQLYCYDLSSLTDFKVAMHYQQEELKPYVGYKIDNIAVRVAIDSDDLTVTLFVISNGETLLSRDITSSVNNNSETVIDVSADNLQISAEGDLFIGYKVDGGYLDDAYIYMDGGDPINGGNYYSYGSYGWSQGEYNFIITANLSYSNSEILNDSGFTYIQKPQSTYSAGDEFVLKMVKNSENPYTSVVWEVNSESKSDGSAITLSKGVTEIKATVTYASGRSEVIITKLKVE